MDDELILALVGIGFAVVALGALAVVQQNRIRGEKQKKAAARPDSEDGEPGPFFIAQYRGSKARFFRVYTDEDALLFLYAGPFMAMVDADTARGTDRRGWVAQSARLLVAGLAVGAVAAVVILVVVGKNVAANATANPEAAGAIMSGVIGVIGLLAVAFAIAIPGVVWRITRRAKELNAMTLNGLRRQAETDDWSFRATPENVTKVKFAVLDRDRNDGQACATLSFKHQPTGKWSIETTTTGDTSAAIAAFREVFEEEAVEVAPGLDDRPISRPAKRKKTAIRSAEKVEEVLSPDQPPPRFGFPLMMLAGYLLGSAAAGAVTYALSQDGRFTYTGLFKMLCALSTLGTYGGHVAGAFRNKSSGLQPFGQMPLGAMSLGAAMVLGGSFAIMSIVWSVKGPLN